MKNILIASTLLVLFFTNNAFAEKGKREAGFDKTEHGLLYKIYKPGTGKTRAKVGDFVEMHIQQVLSETDSILMDTRKVNNNQPVSIQLRGSAFDGDIPEGFTYMSEGDSAVFLVSIDTLITKIPGMPSFFHKGYFLEFRVVMYSVKTEEQMKKEQTEKAAKQGIIDENLLQDYFKKNNITPTKTGSGLYYTVKTPGTGNNPKTGQKVTMKYTGKLLDGTKFDSNVDTNFHHAEPFTFVIGQGQVIKGWDEGIALLKKGSKATLYIPSPLAYGERSPAAIIPANSILVFDVEVLKIENQTTDEMTPASSPGTKPTTPVKTDGRKMNTSKQK